MIFHKKIFQHVMAPIPLFQTPQKIGLLKEQEIFDFHKKPELSTTISPSFVKIGSKTKKLKILSHRYSTLEGVPYQFF